MIHEPDEIQLSGYARIDVAAGREIKAKKISVASGSEITGPSSLTVQAFDLEVEGNIRSTRKVTITDEAFADASDAVTQSVFSKCGTQSGFIPSSMYDIEINTISSSTEHN